MESFEDFRIYLIRCLALQLGIPVENRAAWDLWVAIHDECPEAARLASDQWLKPDLLAEHLLYGDQVRNLTDAAIADLATTRVRSGLAGYVCMWQQFNMLIQKVITQHQKVVCNSFMST